MALVKRNDGNFLINLNPQQFGNARQARSLFRVDGQRARDIAQQLRNAGVECYAAQDGGSEDDPAFQAPKAEVNISVTWPGDWRIEIERVSENRFVHSFMDSTGNQQSVIGPTPQAVVDKLAARFDFESKKYLASITPAPEPAVVARVESVPEGPKKFLRAGDRHFLTPEDVADLAAQRAAREVPVAQPIEFAYLQFYNAASGAEIRARKAKDQEFFNWMVSQNLLVGRSDDARN